MKLERCVTGTLAEVTETQAAVDKALGYPRKGVHVGGGRHVDMPETWDGVGKCPPGWSKSACEPVAAQDGTVYLAVTGLEADLADEVKLARLTGRERAAVARVAAQARDVNLKAIISAAEVNPEAPGLGTKAKVAIGVGAAVTIAAAAYEIAQQMGLLN